MTSEDQKIREQFPIFSNRDIVYLDNSATSQRPQCVIDAMSEFYQKYNANPLRGLYELSVEATDLYETARQKTADFIHAKYAEEIIFTRNTTESLNLIAFSYGVTNVKKDDEIIVTIEEHHSNLLPWQQVAKRTGASIRFLYCQQDGSFDMEEYKSLLNEHTKIVAMTQMSNIFGRINDIKSFAALAHEYHAVFVCDGAQSTPHLPVDVVDLDVDFFAFSGHKMYAPMGIGVCYGKKQLLEDMPPFLFGGEMIEYVTTESATYAEVPHKFEAGTVNAAGVYGLSAAIDFINRYGFETIMKKEERLTSYAMEKMKGLSHVTILGSQDSMEHNGILTFKIDGVHPHDVAAIFDSNQIAIRAGHHCAQPLHKYLGVLSTSRASLAFYNTTEDIDQFIEVLSQIRRKMGYDE